MGDLDENEEPPLLDFVGQEVAALGKHMAEQTLAALSTVEGRTPNSVTVTITNLSGEE